MSKVSTPLGAVSAEDMYQHFVKELLKNNPNYKARRFKYITNGEVYKQENGEDIRVITYPQFKEILSEYNTVAGEKIIQGYTLAMGTGLGDIFAARIQRPTSGRRLDRGASFKRRKELKEAGTLTNENWKITYTDDDFIMVMWHRGLTTPNIHLYKFKTAGGQPGKGFRAKLSNAIKTNPALKGIYPFLPTKVLTNKE